MHQESSGLRTSHTVGVEGAVCEIDYFYLLQFLNGCSDSLCLPDSRYCFTFPTQHGTGRTTVGLGERAGGLGREGMAGMSSKGTFYCRNSQLEFTCGCLQAQLGKHIYP